MNQMQWLTSLANEISREQDDEMEIWDGEDPMDGYERVEWPHSQDFMDEPWYMGESVLDLSDCDNYPMRIFIPTTRYEEFMKNKFRKEQPND